MRPSTSAWIAFAVLFAASTLLFGAVLFPLWQPLLLGAVLAGALEPWHARLSARLAGRSSLTAALVVIALFVLVLVPLVVLAAFAVREAAAGVSFIRETLAAGGVASLQRLLPPSLESWVERLVPDAETLTQ